MEDLALAASVADSIVAYWHNAAFAALHNLGRDWSKADKRALTDLD